MFRLLFLTGSLVHGGAERHSITLMNRLAEAGDECHARYIQDDPSQLGRIVRRSAGSVDCLHARRYLDPAALTRLADDLRTLQPTAILAANPYAVMYAGLARRRAGLPAPLLATFHSTCLVGLKAQVKMLVERFFLNAADALVFVCEAQRRYWEARGIAARQNVVIANGVDTAHFHPEAAREAGQALRARYGFAPGDRVTGLLAVLRPEKAPLQLLTAVARLRQLGIPASALFIGDGPLRPAVEATARALGIGSAVAITGLLEDVRPAIAACDTLALCSTTEALSLAALEAMAMGRPVVHSAVGGAAELIRPGENGFLFPAGDSAALTSVLARLADRDFARQLGRAARDTVLAGFSETAMVDRYQRLLRALSTGRSPAFTPGPTAPGLKPSPAPPGRQHPA